jgi:predicted protein tyrosine phosphatase
LSKRKILFICNANQCRSPTAEWLYEKNDNLLVMSAGIYPEALNPISRELLEWADQIFVFEKAQRNKIRKMVPDLYARLNIECLYIADDYAYRDPLLVYMLKRKLSKYLGVPQRDC